MLLSDCPSHPSTQAMQAATRLALDSLARSALEAADSLPLTHLAQAEWEYESLRAAARALNTEQGWATEALARYWATGVRLAGETFDGAVPEE